MSSSKATPPHSPNSPGNASRAPQSRFIPREELAEFAAWRPGSFGNPEPPSPHPSGKPVERASAPVVAPEPTEADWLEAVQHARDGGYQDGYRDGLVALDAFKSSFAKQVSGQFGQMIASLDNQWNELERAMADAVMRTAVQLARQVVRHELDTRPETIARVAQEAVGAIVLSARHLRVHVNPADCEFVAEGCAEALKARDARVVADPGVEQGGVMVQSDLGQVDARIASRWAQAAAVFGRNDPWKNDDPQSAGYSGQPPGGARGLAPERPRAGHDDPQSAEYGGQPPEGARGLAPERPRAGHDDPQSAEYGGQPPEGARGLAPERPRAAAADRAVGEGGA